MVMAHASSAKFSVFRLGRPETTSGRGMYFGRAPEDINTYGYGGNGRSVYLCFLNIRNLYNNIHIHEKNDAGRIIPNDIMNEIIGASSYEMFLEDLKNYPKKFGHYQDITRNISKNTYQKIHDKYDGKGLFASDKHVVKHIFKKNETYLTLNPSFIGELVTRDPNQIKSATDNTGTFSKEDDSILKRILTLTEYQDMIDELSLSEDNVSAFLYNFVTKVLNTNPRYKVDETPDDFAYKSLQNSDVKQFGESLLKKIFGYEVGTIGGSREDFINAVNNLLDSWSSRLMDIVNNPPRQSTLANLYNERSSIRNQINLLQKSLDRAYLTDTEKTELLTLASRLRVNLENRRSVGFKIQKLKSDIRTTEKAIRKANFQNHAMLLAAKNRLVAINTIPNLKDLVKKRLIAEYDSRTINKDTKQKLESKRQLFDAIQKVIRSSSLSERNTALFNETEQRETSYNEVFDKIIEQVPEAKGLLSLFQIANPNLRLFVGGSPE